jgi:hypothetical protein
MPTWRSQFTHGDPAIEDRWQDFIDGLLPLAYEEAKQKRGA